MCEINFYDAERNLIMRFKDFKFSSTEALKRIIFNGEITIEFVHFETSFEAEEYDFQSLLSSLKKMNGREQKYITFNPFSDKIILRLSEELGQICVKVEIHNELSTLRLGFEYNIDQSFLHELIDELEVLLKRGVKT